MEDVKEVFIPEKFQQAGIAFFQAYDLDKIIVCPDRKMKGLLPKLQRICRFCNSRNGDTSFKTEAHIIPKMLGNKYLVSDFECDTCNRIFSNYESHLSHFFGPVRAFQKLYGLGQDYKFKSPDKKVIAENFNSYGLENSFSISRDDVKDQTFDFNRTGGEVKIKFIKHSYSPLLVYKSILKIALSCLSEKDVKGYELGFKYLHSNILDDKVKGIAKMVIFSMPPGTGHKTAFAVMYKKKDPNRKISTHVFVIYFMNQVYQIFIPLHKSDLTFYNNELLDVLYCPPIFHDSETANTIQIKDQLLDMSSIELVKGEEEILTFKYDVQEYAKGVAYDPSTNEIKEGTFDPNRVVKLVILPVNATLNIPQKTKKNI